jgi:nitrite reductase/ring-hydroxylating ferredoxin subunit
MIKNGKTRMIMMIVGCGLLGYSCGGDSPVPYVRTDFTVNIYTCNLINVGGYEYFTGGYAGFFVYRVDLGTFYAYDRACAYDWESGGYVVLDSNNSFQLQCQRCGSTFNILNGYPQGSKTKASSPLRAYNARMEGDQWLRVYN